MARPFKIRPKIVERKLGREQAYGQHFGHGLIEIDPRLRPWKYFKTLVHELIHEYFPTLSENQVRLRSVKMAKALWSQNVRIVKQ